jgi:hypothetical protein
MVFQRLGKEQLGAVWSKNENNKREVSWEREGAKAGS